MYTRQALTSLTHRPSNALQVYLSLLYTAHLEFEPGDRWKNGRANNGVDGWSELCGLLALDVSNRELNLRMTRALTKLAEHDLVQAWAPVEASTDSTASPCSAKTDLGNDTSSPPKRPGQ